VPLEGIIANAYMHVVYGSIRLRGKLRILNNETRRSHKRDCACRGPSLFTRDDVWMIIEDEGLEN
jgi:hypothetical protein